MSSYTRPPWRLRFAKTSNFGGRRAVIDNWPAEGRIVVCEIPYSTTDLRRVVVAEDNATLIHAAPDLYGAVKGFLEDYDSVRVGMGERFHLTVDRLDEMRVAAAKAITRPA